MENSYDVVILGGGTSGCSCAYNCAKLNLKTLLVEKNNFLGGLMTAGLVIPVMKSSTSDLNCDYYNQLVALCKKYNAQITYKDKNDGWFNPELLKIILDEILSLPKLEILFETDILDVVKNNDSIQNVILSHKLLSLPIVAKYYVDATGDAKLSKLSDCSFLTDNDLTQQSTLRFIVGNVDTERFCKFISSVDLNEDITNTYRDESNTRNELHFTTASTWDENKKWALDKYLKKGVEDNLLIDRDRSYFQIFSVAAGAGQVAFNCPRIDCYKNNPFKYSLELINARKAIYRLFSFVKAQFAGFENAIITNIASQTGIREENRVKTKYVFTKDDIISPKKTANPVLNANYSIDVHSKDKNKSVLQKTGSYTLPIESLISSDISNLFVIGKILGADFYAHSALRVQKSCMSMGEAVAKYIASIEK